MKLIKLVLVLISILGVARASNTSFTYDAAGRLVSADYAAGKSTSYAYDNAGNLIQSSQPAPGIILGPVVNDRLTLTWPAAPGGFVLETSPALNSSATWTNANLTATWNGNRLSVTIPVGNGTKFYRLRKP